MNCSNCGAALGLDAVEARACRFCGTAVRADKPRTGHASIFIDARVVAYIEALMKASASEVDPSVVIEAAKRRAQNEKRSYVRPDDVKAVAPDVLGVDEAVVRKALDLTEVT